MSEPVQNPKHIRAQKDGKMRLEYLPVSQWENDAAVHQHGGEKYGLRNWRIDSILASTYVGAMLRHLKAWIEGEDIDPDSGKPHLTHLRACCAVVLDGAAYGKLIDDRLLCESKDPSDGAVRSAHVHKPVCNHEPAEDCPVHPMTEENQIPVDLPGLSKLRGSSVLEREAVALDLAGYPSPRCVDCQQQICTCALPTKLVVRVPRDSAACGAEDCDFCYKDVDPDDLPIG